MNGPVPPAVVLKVALWPGHRTRLVNVVAVVGTDVSTVMVCVQVAELLQASLAAYVRVMVTIGPLVTALSPTKLLTGVLQSSVAVTDAGFGAGTWANAVTVMLVGHVILGGLVSLTVTTREQLLEQKLLKAIRFTVKICPQLVPATTVAAC